MEYVQSTSGIFTPHPWQERQGNLLVKWRYNGQEGEYIDKDQNYQFNTQTGELFCFQWEENNYSCDCNRSVFFGLAEKYPELAKDQGTFPCGDTIEVTSITEAH